MEQMLLCSSLKEFFKIVTNLIFLRFIQDLRQGRGWTCLWSESRFYCVDQNLADLQLQFNFNFNSFKMFRIEKIK